MERLRNFKIGRGWFKSIYADPNLEYSLVRMLHSGQDARTPLSSPAVMRSVNGQLLIAGGVGRSINCATPDGRVRRSTITLSFDSALTNAGQNHYQSRIRHAANASIATSQERPNQQQAQCLSSESHRLLRHRRRVCRLAKRARDALSDPTCPSLRWFPGFMSGFAAIGWAVYTFDEIDDLAIATNITLSTGIRIARSTNNARCWKRGSVYTSKTTRG